MTGASFQPFFRVSIEVAHNRRPFAAMRRSWSCSPWASRCWSRRVPWCARVPPRVARVGVPVGDASDVPLQRTWPTSRSASPLNAARRRVASASGCGRSRAKCTRGFTAARGCSPKAAAAPTGRASRSQCPSSRWTTHTHVKLCFALAPDREPVIMLGDLTPPREAAVVFQTGRIAQAATNQAAARRQGGRRISRRRPELVVVSPLRWHSTWVSGVPSAGRGLRCSSRP